MLGLLACSSLTHAIPIAQQSADVTSILNRRAAVDACPGYTASNVVESDSGLTADLTLSGASRPDIAVTNQEGFVIHDT